MNKFTAIFLLTAVILLPAMVRADKPDLAAADANCAKLSELDCWKTKGCVLNCLDKSENHCSPYRCHAALNECESEYSQKDTTLENCGSRPGCHFSAAFCFCPGPLECVCGGGPPAQCRKY